MFIYWTHRTYILPVAINKNKMPVYMCVRAYMCSVRECVPVCVRGCVLYAWVCASVPISYLYSIFLLNFHMRIVSEIFFINNRWLILSSTCVMTCSGLFNVTDSIDVFAVYMFVCVCVCMCVYMCVFVCDMFMLVNMMSGCGWVSLVLLIEKKQWFQ